MNIDERKPENILTSVKKIRKMTQVLSKMEDDDEISFDFVLMGLFPKVWDNIQLWGSDMYTKGYIEGLKEAKNNEDKGN